jgi:hypothetical protein
VIRKIFIRLGACVAVGLSGCASEPRFFNVANVEIVLPTGSDTDYAVGQSYATQRELLATRQTTGLWASAYALTGQNLDLVDAETQPYWSLLGRQLPDVVVVTAGTTLKIIQVEPPSGNGVGAVPHILAEFTSGPLQGKRVAVAAVSREKRFVDPEFLAPEVQLPSRS